MKRLIALLICVMLSASFMTFPVSAAELPFEPGTPGTFFAPTFGDVYSGREDIVGKFYFDPAECDEQGSKAYAKLAAGQLDVMPEGRKIIQLSPRNGAEIMENALCGGLLLNPAQVEFVKERMDGFFSELKALGTEVDIVFDDMESGLSIWGFENRAIANFRLPGEDLTVSYANNGHLYEDWIKQELLAIEKDPLYQSKLRPALEEGGFIFSENYDLEYINIHPGAIEPRRSRFYESNPPEGAETAYLVAGSVLGGLGMEGYREAIYDTMKKYYPDIKFSNWETSTSSGIVDAYDFNGNFKYAKGDPPKKLTTTSHANVVVYGYYNEMAGWIYERVPREWRYETFPLNGFNQLKKNYIDTANRAVAADGKISVWISNKTYSYNTPYYAEAILHAGLFNPDPFLFYQGTPTNLGSDLDHLEDLFDQLDELVGHDDRKSLINGENISDWDYRYVLSGMYAGGKNVWRITPDLYAAGVTKENFLVKENPPTFRIGNQNIEFPAGSYIYTPENDVSEYGYWVISPKDSGNPKEWRDSKHSMPGKPIGDYDADDRYELPTGYQHEPSTEKPDELDLSRSRDRKNVPATNPDDSTGENTDAPPVTDVVIQTLNLNPMRGDGGMMDLFLDKLPADSQNHWAKHTLANMFALGIMKGTGSGMEPDNSITTAEFLAMLERILGAEEIAFEGNLPDVKAEDWYANVIQTAVSGGWIEVDYVTGNANPNEKITRAEMCSVIVKALNLTESKAYTFNDGNSVIPKIKENIAKVAAIGLIEGYEDGSFRPNIILTRAETATVFERLLKQIPVLFAETE